MRIRAFGHELIIMELRKVVRNERLNYYRDPDEPRARKSTMRFTFGNARAYIFSPYDDSTGQPAWRFSLKKVVGTKRVCDKFGTERDEDVLRVSFEDADVDDLHLVLNRTLHYIRTAKQL